MPTHQTSRAMRQAAPEQCQQLDKLRAERKRAIEHRCHVSSMGREDEVAATQQRIMEIDAEIATLHASAKERLNVGLADGLVEGANKLQNAMHESDGILTTIAQEQRRHNDAMTKLITDHRQLGDSFNEAIGTMVTTANEMDPRPCSMNRDDGDEQPEVLAVAVGGVSTPAPAGSSTDANKPAPAGSSTDMECPACAKVCHGVRGLASHRRTCKVLVDKEQAAAPLGDIPASAEN